MTTDVVIEALAARDEVVWENSRYGARYVIDLPELRARLERHLPVVHVGQVEAVDAVRGATPDATWLVVYVWCPRDVAQRRIEARRTGDTEDRLQAWDETAELRNADLTLNTADVSPEAAAQKIHGCITAIG